MVHGISQCNRGVATEMVLFSIFANLYCSLSYYLQEDQTQLRCNYKCPAKQIRNEFFFLATIAFQSENCNLTAVGSRIFNTEI